MWDIPCRTYCLISPTSPWISLRRIKAEDEGKGCDNSKITNELLMNLMSLIKGGPWKWVPEMNFLRE